MNTVQKRYRINDRQFIDSEIKLGFDRSADMVIEKSVNGNYKELLEGANIPYNNSIKYWIPSASGMLNLFNAMDILDGCDRRIYKVNDNSGKYMMKSTPMNDGTHKISIHYLPDTEEELYVSTNLGNDKLAYDYQMAYDIYAGCPRFEWSTDVESHIKNAIRIINSAKDGNVFRRDLFSCESYGITFVPIDIINLKITIGKQIKDVPYITGFIVTPKDISPYAIKTSLAKVSRQYLNEEVLLPGECISLSNMNNLFVQIIEDKKQSKIDVDKITNLALSLLTNAKARHVSNEDRLDILKKYTCTEYDPVLGYIDDYARREKAAPEVLPRLLKYTPYQTAM